MRKILFLDVDGVLNDLQVLSTREELGESHLNNLKAIVNIAKCEIVLSSTWRIYKESQYQLKMAFLEKEIPFWIDVTPFLQNKTRSEEIKLWLKDNIQETAKVVILDDDKDANLIQCPNNVDVKFIQTCMNYGLTTNHAITAIEFFK